MITKITKMVPKKYYVIDGVEFSADNLLNVLETIVGGDPEDLEYYFYGTAEKLEELGYLNHRWNYDADIVYCDTKDKKAKVLFDEILNL